MKRAVSEEKGEKVRQKRGGEADTERRIMRTDRGEYLATGIFHISHNISFLPSDSGIRDPTQGRQIDSLFFISRATPLLQLPANREPLPK